jgi:hypothetical protein
MSDKYILVDGEPQACDDLMTWGQWFETHRTERILQQDHIGDVKVSTVFLGLDHSFGEGPPLLWETMIFGGVHDSYTDRYSTAAEALEGHRVALALVTSGKG